MKQRLINKVKNLLTATLCTLALGLAPLASVHAADNAALGGIGGVNNSTLINGDGSGTALFSLVSRQLTLYKTAYLTDGTELTSGARLPSGTVVHFLIYVNNDTSVQIDNVQMTDTLNALFAYAANNTIKVGTTAACTNGGANDGTCDQTERDALWTAVSGGAGTTTDGAAAGDVISYAGTTVSVGKANASNDQLDVAANTAWAVLIPITMQ